MKKLMQPILATQVLLIASGGEDDMDEEIAELGQLIQRQPQTGLTLQQTIQATEHRRKGWAVVAELENEDGSLVYEVTIGETKILVDAGIGWRNREF